MLRLIILGVTVHFLASSSQVLANICEDLFNSPPKKSIQEQIVAVNSAEALAKLLTEVGELSPNASQYVQKTAMILWRDLKSEEVQQLVRNILLNHRHVAKDSVQDAVREVIASDTARAYDIERKLPKPMDEKKFLRWLALSETFRSNTSFLKKLYVALQDFKNFDYIYGKHIDSNPSHGNILKGFEELKNPSLVGQLIELFMNADRPTRQYIISEIARLKTESEEQIAVVLTENAVAAIESVLAKGLNRIEEDAYFRYESNGVGNRPTLPGLKKTKTVALRLMDRLNFDLTIREVDYAADVLAEYPKPDPEVDLAMMKLLESGSRLEEWEHEHRDVFYAFHELHILKRKAKGLSSLNIDLKYSTAVLSKKTIYRIYFMRLIEFHDENDLRNFPALQKLVVAYFKKYPESLGIIPKTHADGVNKFIRDNP